MKRTSLLRDTHRAVFSQPISSLPWNLSIHSHVGWCANGYRRERRISIAIRARSVDWMALPTLAATAIHSGLGFTLISEPAAHIEFRLCSKVR
jgi:hypothetical protein